MLFLYLTLFIGCEKEVNTDDGLISDDDIAGTNNNNNNNNNNTNNQNGQQIAIGVAPPEHNKGDWFRSQVKKGPPPGLVLKQCNGITGIKDGGPVNGPGCVTSDIKCGQTIIGHTRGGGQNFDTKWYDDNFCWPATRNHNGGDERVYRFVPRENGVTERFWAQVWLDTPCEQHIDMTMFMSQDRKACPPKQLKNCEMPNPFSKGNQFRRHHRTLINAYGSNEVWYIVVEGADDKEGAFALTMVCEGVE